MSKKYRLVKDLPDAEAGTIFEYTEDGYYTSLIPGEDGVCGKWPPHYVHSNPKWFELINERVVVDIIYLKGASIDMQFVYKLFSSARIPEDKLDSIKLAMEKILNEDKDTANIFLKQDVINQLGVKYTKEQLDDAIVDAFNASRYVFPTAVGRIEYSNGDWSNHYAPRYMNAKDYLDHLKCNNNNHNSE